METQSKKVKSRITYRQNYVVLENPQQANNDKCYAISTIEYDLNDNITKEITYNDKGDLEQILKKSYDDKNRLVSETTLFSEDEIAEELILDYDQKGNVIKEIKKYAEGGSDETFYKYDEAGHLIEKYTIDDEGALEKKDSFTYSSGLIIERKRVDESETLVEHQTFKYDENNRISEHYKWILEDDFSITIINKYDEKGNIIEAISLDSANVQIEKSSFTYNEKGLNTEFTDEGKNYLNHFKLEYDEHDNMISQEHYDINSTMQQQIRRMFDENGNIILFTMHNKDSDFGYNNNYSLVYEYAYF